jgi:hypothetical protein
MSNQAHKNKLLICGRPASGKTSLAGHLNPLVASYRILSGSLNDIQNFNERPHKIILIADVNQLAQQVMNDVMHIRTLMKYKNQPNTPILVLINKVDQIIHKLFQNDQFIATNNYLHEFTLMIKNLGWHTTMNYFQKTKQVQFHLFMANPHPNVLYEAHINGLLYPIMNYNEVKQWVSCEDNGLIFKPNPHPELHNSYGSNPPELKPSFKIDSNSHASNLSNNSKEETLQEQLLHKMQQHQDLQGDLNGDG